jgi:uncharacterized protein YlxW (UPF0749 family)
VIKRGSTSYSKERLIHARHPHWSEELYRLAGQEADLAAQLKELEEAIEAGEAAQKALQETHKSLDSAIGWSGLMRRLSR